MGSEKIDPRFKHETYERNIFATREELTKLSSIILDMKTGMASLIINGIRIAALLALFRIRQAMFSEEMMIGRQIYERRRRDDNRSDLENDDLDVEKK